MSDDKTISPDDWMNTKIVVAKAVHRGMYSEAYDLLHDCHLLVDHGPDREGQIKGMLFVLGALKGRDGGKA